MKVDLVVAAKPPVRPILLAMLALFTIIPTVSFGQTEVADPPKADKDFALRLEKLSELFEKERVKNHIPGLALAIVKDDKVVFAEGFGLSDLDGKTPVDKNTMFAIGSSTKPFTSAIVAMLVDEGKMDWDDPVAKFLPEFKMKIDTGDQEITIRDLLCHRTGFTRMGLIWAGGKLKRDEVIKVAANAEPYAGFRDQFQYNNVMYMTAGVCAGKANGSSWEKLLAERLFAPLDMKATNTSIVEMQKNEKAAKGYIWDKDREDYVMLPMRDLESIGPSGSINSSVSEMANWIRMQLNEGTFNDVALVSKDNLGETRSKQIAVGGGVDYGMGWMLHKWGGKDVVEHGGNIDGFSAQVTLLPELNTGYVLLANVTATQLQGGSISLVFDTLFGDSNEGSNINVEKPDLDSLVGNYIANFGPFNNAGMEVTKNDSGTVSINVPGQTNYELKLPDDEGKWFFALTDTIAVSFNKDDAGKVKSITMHQAGMTPEFLREDYDHQPETPLDQLAALFGKYRDEESKQDVQISAVHGRIVANVGNAGTFVFSAADKDGFYSMRANPAAFKIRFNKDEDGTIKSLTRVRGSTETEMIRVEGESKNSFPSMDELIAKMKAAYGTWDEGAAGAKLVGSANMHHQGVTGTVEATYSNSGKHITHTSFGELADIVESYDGEEGISYTSISRYEKLAGKKLKSMRMRNIMDSIDSWNDDFASVAITGEGSVHGDDTYLIALTDDDSSVRKLQVSKQTGLIREEVRLEPHDAIGYMPITLTYYDYKNVGGIQFPMMVTSENPFTGRTTTEFNSSKVLEGIPEGTFKFVDPTEE